MLSCYSCLTPVTSLPCSPAIIPFLTPIHGATAFLAVVAVFWLLSAIVKRGYGWVVGGAILCFGAWMLSKDTVPGEVAWGFVIVGTAICWWPKKKKE